jgi:hypothetical protein
MPTLLRLQSWVPDADTSRKLQKADFGRFAAIMCADASFGKMCTVAKAFAWVRCLYLLMNVLNNLLIQDSTLSGTIVSFQQVVSQGERLIDHPT